MNRVLAALLFLPAIALAAPVPKAEKGENKLYVTINGCVVKMNPDGSGEEKLFDDRHAGSDMRVSPDGKWVAYATSVKQTLKWDIGVREVGGEPKLLVTQKSRSGLFWSADSKALVGCEEVPLQKGRFGGDEAWKNWSIDVASGKRTDLDVPTHYRVMGLRPDGKDFYYATATELVEKNGRYFVRSEVATDVRKPEPKVLVPGDHDVRPLVAFPDGKRWIVHQVQGSGWGVYTVGEKEVALWDGEARWPYRVAVSPDGKRVAYAVYASEHVAKKSPSELRTADADGKNSVTVLKTAKHIDHIEWR